MQKCCIYAKVGFSADGFINVTLPLDAFAALPRTQWCLPLHVASEVSCEGIALDTRGLTSRPMNTLTMESVMTPAVTPNRG